MNDLYETLDIIEGLSAALERTANILARQEEVLGEVAPGMERLHDKIGTLLKKRVDALEAGLTPTCTAVIVQPGLADHDDFLDAPLPFVVELLAKAR